MAYLHWSGAHEDALPGDVFDEVHAQGDGFRKLDADTLREVNDGFDWSHVRDSTSQGWAGMAAVPRDRGYGLEGGSTPSP